MKGTRDALGRATALGVVSLGVVLLLTGRPLLAQQEDLTEKKKELESAIELRTEGNSQAAKVQDQIDEISDKTDELVTQYRTTLKQIDSIRVYNDQMRALIAAQEEEKQSLADQLGRVDLVGRSVTPLMLRMIDALEQFVELDVPFLLDERKARIAELRTTMDRADVTGAEKYRQIMEAFQI